MSEGQRADSTGPSVGSGAAGKAWLRQGSGLEFEGRAAGAIHVTIQEHWLLSHSSSDHCPSGNVQMEAVSECVFGFEHCIYSIPEGGF